MGVMVMCPYIRSYNVYDKETRFYLRRILLVLQIFRMLSLPNAEHRPGSCKQQMGKRVCK